MVAVVVSVVVSASVEGHTAALFLRACVVSAFWGHGIALLGDTSTNIDSLTHTH